MFKSKRCNLLGQLGCWLPVRAFNDSSTNSVSLRGSTGPRTWETCWVILQRLFQRGVGSFSIKDSYGIKKVTSKKNSHFSNLVPFIRPRGRRIYPGVEFLGTALKVRKRKRISSTCFHVSITRRIRKFTSWSCSDGKEMYQTVCCACKLLFCL